MVCIRVTQRFEDRVVPINLSERCLFHVAARDRQKAGRLDVARMRDEHEAVPVIRAARRLGEVVMRMADRRQSNLFSFQILLPGDAPIKLCLGRRDDERDVLLQRERPTEYIFMPFWRDWLEE